MDNLAGPYREEAASVRMLANLLFNSKCALCISDAQQAEQPIVYVNRMFEQATGYSASEVTARQPCVSSAGQNTARLNVFRGRERLSIAWHDVVGCGAQLPVPASEGRRSA